MDTLLKKLTPNKKCVKCKFKCNSIYFQQNFKNWTSGNEYIDKFIQDSQVLSHKNYRSNLLEWIPYDRFHNIRYIENIGVYKANWIDGYIHYWDYVTKDWRRFDQNMFVTLKLLNEPKIIALEFKNEINIPCGITQNPQTKDYMMVLRDKCKQCICKCNSIYFKQNFGNWTSGNDDIDEFIQNTQLLAHKKLPVSDVLEWIPYNRLNNIKYIERNGLYNANLIDGCICKWSVLYQNWERENQNMLVTLKYLNNPINVTEEFMNEIKIDYEFYGITQDPQTKNYMIVLSDKCKKCNSKCNAIHFKQNFESWTSGNDVIDQFIQDSQLSDHHNDVNEALEWINYDRFNNIEYVSKGGFGEICKANWIDGCIDKWDNINQNWKRHDENMVVALKSLNHSKNITLEFMNEMILHHKLDSNYKIIKFYGITQNPETENYVMVLEYADDGSLRKYLDTNFNKLLWRNKFIYLYDIINGLRFIHESNLIHRNLHSGNILKLKYNAAITDIGLCKPANCNVQKNNIYGVLPYIAPEILRGQTYTQAADIYSFGIIMYEVISGLPPFYDLSHDEYLAIKICQGLRPRFDIKVPQLIVDLIKSCLDANLLMRPKAEEIRDILYIWRCELASKQTTEIQKQIKEADVTNNNSNYSISSTCLGLSYKTHSEAIYTSRLLNFDNLPEPKNSDDFYEQNDNIISIESSGTV
ncbi:Ypk2p [Rhizophagus irregularis DAOM 197198w]|uniref:Ypk2p n=1 Tax=Rhizophagus irregularis (strain DAOM 197198w) TaxID=1432141 RepID=A0A015L6I9_RHIIW|nr:Ypk2p [Rhizophagus irregularis DAOM 197198w]